MHHSFFLFLEGGGMPSPLIWHSLIWHSKLNCKPSLTNSIIVIWTYQLQWWNQSLLGPVVVWGWDSGWVMVVQAQELGWSLAEGYRLGFYSSYPGGLWSRYIQWAQNHNEHICQNCRNVMLGRSEFCTKIVNVILVYNDNTDFSIYSCYMVQHRFLNIHIIATFITRLLLSSWQYTIFIAQANVIKLAYCTFHYIYRNQFFHFHRHSSRNIHPAM